ncbi:MAG: 2-C-methyl-D-erythritol 4-phosphate cytidylyltransferase [Actinomycetota bacterium]
METWGLVVAGGSGARFGRPKQFEPLGDRRVVDWAVDSLTSACAGVVVVVPADMVDAIDVPAATLVVAGGADRSASVRAGLATLGPDATHVLVHDAARPLASTDLVATVIAALADGAPGVVPVVPVTDSLRSVDGRSVDRDGFVAVQTPQGFDLATLRTAHARGASASDDATLLDELGVQVRHVSGEATNFKVTQPHDLAVARAVLDAG